MEDTVTEDLADFVDVLEANEAYAQSFELAGLLPRAARGLAIVTCMDSRIEPLDMLGLNPGDAKIIRNAGARVTEDVLRTLALATHLLGVERIMVVAHTNCKMASATRDEVIDIIEQASGIDVRSLDFRLIADQRETLGVDVQKIRSWPYLPPNVAVGGFIYDVDTGRVTREV
ncbi:beta-class carbonic anhydrase [Phytoactinopolyspora halotolerans]|nr:carbonic anhydrase [Phytoactinopolyspora halotolerans]